jgi:hypothetical protein
MEQEFMTSSMASSCNQPFAGALGRPVNIDMVKIATHDPRANNIEEQLVVMLDTGQSNKQVRIRSIRRSD